MAPESVERPEVEQVINTCPACKVRSLFDHCPSPTCTWHHCRNKACDLVADLRRGRGHKLPLAPAEKGFARTRWVA